MKNGSSCPTFLTEPIPAVVNTGIYIAIAVGFAILAGLAIVLGYWLTKSKTEDDVLLKGVDPFTTGQTVTNPIHEPSTKIYTNKLFDEVGGGNDGL